MDFIINGFISERSQFTTDEFACMLRESEPEIGRSTIYKKLQSLCDQGMITRSGRGHFSCISKEKYEYSLSDTAMKVVSLIHENYPLVEYQIWEIYQLNEFVNHQISRNTVFVEVESMLDETVFNLLFDRFDHVLHSPSSDEYYKYMGDETIVVGKLISESPASYGQGKQTSLEKIMVDLFARGIPGTLIERAEYPGIYERAFSKYNMNMSGFFRYARRRNLENKIKDFIREKTDIQLEEYE